MRDGRDHIVVFVELDVVGRDVHVMGGLFFRDNIEFFLGFLLGENAMPTFASCDTILNLLFYKRSLLPCQCPCSFFQDFIHLALVRKENLALRAIADCLCCKL